MATMCCLKDQFWKIAYEECVEAQRLLESFDSLSKNVSSEHMTPFFDHKEGEGIFIYPRSIFRMRIG